MTRAVRRALSRAAVALLRSRTETTVARFVRGWHQGDQWTFAYEFVGPGGVTYRGSAGTAWDMVHAAHDGDHGLLERFTGPGALRIRYLRARPAIHTVSVDGEQLW